ncbi:hypothetical protein [Peredibacter starrii]|uniref:Uncharacterized protein n=1 Tax=Peredibacter starrii TaxID=28202 RepID=A0AAX4HND7_9BACT|nr:hypothetical protein [Peredibacter starrii]WPU64799.1 hypothetical protein SOO65_19070 [Peredibacter starrii]
MKTQKTVSNDTTQKALSLKSVLIVLSTFIIIGVLIWVEMKFN